jgi:hypothetical protein
VSMATTSGIWHATTMAAQPDRRALGRPGEEPVKSLVVKVDNRIFAGSSGQTRRQSATLELDVLVAQGRPRADI